MDNRINAKWLAQYITFRNTAASFKARIKELELEKELLQTQIMIANNKKRLNELFQCQIANTYELRMQRENGEIAVTKMNEMGEALLGRLVEQSANA